jgi:hypothetical protein
MADEELRQLQEGFVAGKRRRCVLHGRGYGRCDGPIHGHHAVKRQRIEHHLTYTLGADLELVRLAAWDDRWRVDVCDRHHTLTERHAIDFPRWLLGDRVEEAARDWDLAWSLERDYRG